MAEATAITLPSSDSEEDGGTSSDLASRATEALREMIIHRQLAAGEQIRQVELATRLSLSRSPLREALSALESEGLVTHEPKRGYFVRRLSTYDLKEIYRMRELIEPELVARMRLPNAGERAELRKAKREVERAIRDRSVGRMLVANRQFHFRIFALSPLPLTRAEIERLWHLAAPYQATHLWLPGNLDRIMADHDQILGALEGGDLSELLEVLRRHRQAAESNVLELLSAQERA